MVCLTSSKLAIVVVDLTRRRDGSSFGHQSQEKISFYFLSEVKDKVYYKVFLVIKKYNDWVINAFCYQNEFVIIMINYQNIPYRVLHQQLPLCFCLYYVVEVIYRKLLCNFSSILNILNCVEKKTLSILLVVAYYGGNQYK